MKRPTEDIREVVARALAEDVGPGDVTSEAVIPEEATARLSIVQNEPGVLFGLDVAREAFAQSGAESFEPDLPEGQWRDGPATVVARVTGPARALLAAERVALNFLGHLSGVATLTARFVREVEGSGAQVLDTRKTTPGLRALEKAAVVAVGGTNHRMGLHDAILIKDNHVVIAEGVGNAVRRAREAEPELEVQVECSDLREVNEAIEAGADRLLLDNMDPEELREAVSVARGATGSVRLEASGGITLENAAQVAATGVAFISVGGLTHSAPALDLSAEMSAAQWGSKLYSQSEPPE